MSFKTLIKNASVFVLLSGFVLLSACTDEEETNVIREYVQSHQFNIVAIEISPDEDLMVRSNTGSQFEVYGLLADGSRLMTEPDENGDSEDQPITTEVDWFVSDATVGEISQAGLFSSSDTPGVVTLSASFAGQEDSVVITVTDAELAEIEVQGDNQIDVCRNIEFSAIGLLADGNQVSLENEILSWAVTSPGSNVELAEFKDNLVATLSTYLTGTVSITTTDTDTEITSSPFNLEIIDSLQSVTLSVEGETTVTVGESIAIAATAQYADEDADITANTDFIVTRNPDIVTIADNVLTIDSDAPNGETIEVTGSCNNVLDAITITVSNPGS